MQDAQSHFLKQNGILINQLTGVVQSYDQVKADVSLYCSLTPAYKVAKQRSTMQEDVLPVLERIQHDKKLLSDEVAYC